MKLRSIIITALGACLLPYSSFAQVPQLTVALNVCQPAIDELAVCNAALTDVMAKHTQTQLELATCQLMSVDKDIKLATCSAEVATCNSQFNTCQSSLGIKALGVVGMKNLKKHIKAALYYSAINQEAKAKNKAGKALKDFKDLEKNLNLLGFNTNS